MPSEIFYITWKHTSNNFSFPLSLDDKITIFREQIYGWQLNIADILVNDPKKSIHHADFACLQIVLSYFEMISKYKDGYVGNGNSKIHFKKGVELVYPNVFNANIAQKSNLLDRLYKSARCGLYHMGMTKPKFVVYSGRPAINLNNNENRIEVNTHILTKDIISHLDSYVSNLRNSSNTTLRANFENRYDVDHS